MSQTVKNILRRHFSFFKFCHVKVYTQDILRKIVILIDLLVLPPFFNWKACEFKQELEVNLILIGMSTFPTSNWTWP